MEAMHKTGIWTVDYPDSLKRAVGRTAQTWQRFCELPPEVQNVFTTDNMFNGSGFERKSGGGGADDKFSHDSKLNFDVTKSECVNLRTRLDRIESAESKLIAQEFLESISDLVNYAPSAIEQFGETLETECDISGFRQLAKNSAPNAFFRCLYYPPSKTVGETIGEPHVDNSGFTLHLYESTEGCEALSQDLKSWYSMPVTEASALAFPSMQTQLYSEGKVDGLCHRIIANETTHRLGRYAIVCFVPLKGLPPYDRATHGRLQKMKPGFNYGVDSSQFSGYFVKA